MKKWRVLLLVGLLLLGLVGVAKAEESWAADLQTGAKIGWIHDLSKVTSASWSGPVIDGKAEGKGSVVFTIHFIDGKDYTGRMEAEMQAGKLHGKVSQKWSNGDTFEGTYVNGVIEGNGVYRYAERGGRFYDGQFKNNKPDGYGVYKEANGKVVYEGQWIDGNPAIRPALDKVLGIPWGASPEDVKKAMLARPKTLLKNEIKNGAIVEQQYWGPFNDQEQWIVIRLFEGRMYLVAAGQSIPQDMLDQLMEKFDAARKGLTEKYGNPDSERGKYLDSMLQWYWVGNKYAAINLSAVRTAETNPPSFTLRLVYIDVLTFAKAEVKASSTSNDF